MHKVLAIVLADGMGQALQPLTRDRAKAALPFGGKYRLIDFALSNCLHSGLRRVLVLTQYKFHSLQKHLRDGWSIFNPELAEYITMVPPQMRGGENIYHGTADGLYQNIHLLERSQAEWIVVAAGDHVYRMDYAELVRAHIRTRADVTIAAIRAGNNAAFSYGRIVAAADGQVTSVGTVADKSGGGAESIYAGMNVYVFSRDVLLRALEEDHANNVSRHDLNRDVLPKLVDGKRAMVYEFGGDAGRVSPDRYWRDVDTLDAFYDANMDLLRPVPPLNLYQPDWRIWTYVGQHAPARTVSGASGAEGIAINSIMSSGVIIAGGSVQESILFRSVFVDDETFVQQSLLFDGVRVGRGVHLTRCIIDKGVHIPAGERIGVDLNYDRTRFTVTERGVVVVPRLYRFGQS